MSAPRLTITWSRETRHSSSRFLQRPFSRSPNPASRNVASQRSYVLHEPIFRSRSWNQTLIAYSNAPVRSYAQQSAVSRFARNASTPGAAAETYVAYGMTQKLFEACSSQADYHIPRASEKGATVPTTEAGEHLGVGDSWWYRDLGLLPTFSTWSQVTFLHMYLLTVRFRALPTRESVQTYSRHLIDHFSHNAEHRMDVMHDLGSRSVRNKYLKDLFIQWRGIIAAYDEGLIKGDAVLGAAVWRNLWKASPTGPDGKEIDWTKVAWVVAYMRRVLLELSKVDEADLVLGFSTSQSEKPGIFGYSSIDKQLAEALKQPPG